MARCDPGPARLSLIFARRIAIAMVFLAICQFADLSARPLSRPAFGVEDGIRTWKILGQLYSNNPVLLSPLRTRYVVFLLKGDLGNNENIVEILSGSTKTIASASRPKVVTRVRTSAGAPNPLRDLREVRWAGERKILFRWKNDRRHSYEVKELDLVTGNLQTVVSLDSDVLAFSSDAFGQNFVLSASGYGPQTQRGTGGMTGGVVTSPEIQSALNGFLNGEGPWTSFELWIATKHSKPTRIALPLGRKNVWIPHPSLSPGGHLALLELPPRSFPKAWDRLSDQAQLVGIREALQNARSHPDSPSRLSQIWLLNLQDLSLNPVLDVPQILGSSSLIWLSSNTAAIGPTFLPETDGASGPQDVVIVDFSTGERKSLPIPPGLRSHSFRPTQGLADGVLEVQASDASGMRLWFRKKGGSWFLIDDPASREDPSEVRLFWVQDHQTSPRLYAEGPPGRRVEVLNPNRTLTKCHCLASTEIVHWLDGRGVPWTGRLYSARHSQSNRPPLVFQSILPAKPEEEFSLTGSDAINAVFSAQALASRGISVLVIAFPEGGMPLQAVATPTERETMLAGFEGAVTELARQGRIDANRVGLAGFSRSGQYVEYALFKSHIRWRAAVVADNSEASYVERVLVGDDIRRELDRTNGGDPLTGQIRRWLESAPGFNAERIVTPLRIERDSGGLSALPFAWELFSNLRSLGKPVELYVVPEIEDSSHWLEKPRQIQASQQATVDWFNFWLKGTEDPDPAKTEQYTRWRKMREETEGSATRSLPANPI
jgi:hypothetical protein